MKKVIKKWRKHRTTGTSQKIGRPFKIDEKLGQKLVGEAAEWLTTTLEEIQEVLTSSTGGLCDNVPCLAPGVWRPLSKKNIQA